MQATYIWHQFYLHGRKITLFGILVLVTFPFAQAQHQRWVKKNNPAYDERKLSYGFLIGLHSTAYQVRYSDRFVDQAFDTVYAIQSPWSPGFSLGFLVNYRAGEFLDLRITPKVAFYEHRMDYLYTDRANPDRQQLVETTMVELPLLLKYKSVRRGNTRMYMIGGVAPSVEASGKKKLENLTAVLEVKEFNINLEGGFGFDLYFPLFKFSPEIRFSRGLINILDNPANIYGQPLKRLNTNTVMVNFIFQ